MSSIFPSHCYLQRNRGQRGKKKHGQGQRFPWPILLGAGPLSSGLGVLWVPPMSCPGASLHLLPNVRESLTLLWAVSASCAVSEGPLESVVGVALVSPAAPFLAHRPQCFTLHCSPAPGRVHSPPPQANLASAALLQAQATKLKSQAQVPSL